MARATVAAEEVFVVSIGVPHDERTRNAHCKRVLTVLQQAGYIVGPTSGDSILELAEQEQLNRQLAANDPENTE